MNEKALRRVVALAALAGALLWSAFLAEVHLAARASSLDRLESIAVDLRFLALGRRKPPDDVLIVAIDDAAVEQAGTFPVPRRIVGELVASLLSQGARAVVIDILFADPGKPEDNAPLARALAAGPTAVAAIVHFGLESPTSSAQPVVACQLPTLALRPATTVGTVNVSLDRAGIARFVPMLLPCGTGVLPALPLKAASLAAKADPGFASDAVELGEVVTPLDAGRNLALRYYGPEGSIPTLSAGTILHGEAPRDAVRNRIVIVGATASGVGDRYPTPFDSVLPGVEILATAIGNIETGAPLVRTPTVRRLDAGMTLALALCGVGAMLVENVGAGLLAFAVLVALWLGLVFGGFAQGIWFAMAVPLGAAVPAVLVTGGGRLALDRLAAQGLHRRQLTLAAFQSPVMLARLAADPNFLSEPVERDIAVVFIDLSGFTGLSERLGASIIRELLKEWHAIVEEAAAANGGFVASYMADGAMLVWGMAERGSRDADHAVRAALSLQAHTLDWLRSVEPRTGPLGVKIGGHLGPAILSRLGHATHQHITAIGDTVNVASRLMEVAAEHGSTMALSVPLIEEARRQGSAMVDAGFASPVEMPIRGRAQGLPVCLWNGL